MSEFFEHKRKRHEKFVKEITQFTQTEQLTVLSSAASPDCQRIITYFNTIYFFFLHSYFVEEFIPMEDPPLSFLRKSLKKDESYWINENPMCFIQPDGIRVAMNPPKFPYPIEEFVYFTTEQFTPIFENKKKWTFFYSINGYNRFLILKNFEEMAITFRERVLKKDFMELFPEEKETNTVSLEAFRLACVGAVQFLLKQGHQPIKTKEKRGYETFELAHVVHQVFEILDFWIEDIILFANEYKYNLPYGRTINEFLPDIEETIKLAEKFCDQNDILFELSARKTLDENLIGSIRPYYKFQQSY